MGDGAVIGPDQVQGIWQLPCEGHKRKVHGVWILIIVPENSFMFQETNVDSIILNKINLLTTQSQTQKV